MAAHAELVVNHLGLLFFRCLFRTRMMAFEAVLEFQFFMHLHHFRVFAVADIAPVRIRMTQEYREDCEGHDE